ncbi:Hsp20/alpha crystallin family protein [Candidatus Woesearchaeota archaeon]|jgi:HSP20 family protein|nr:Hsp20/alpha crystallin family protein [Candidatus Woesearchaeota archaeon]MBT4731962.1 Hsp20/alpha crystallin family protein [Candidatus Woesearchaeota archaeon]MBT7556448.1 Hsp20/alpha crystallin family protein [Candidatus Woesearchaeota archaeon]
MTKVALHTGIPFFDRDTFLTPFDALFDQVVNTQFPDIAKTVGVNPYKGSSYPKINVYEWDDKVGIIAEIPGLRKKDLNIQVEDGILTISGNKHNTFDVDGAKVLRRELKQSSFKRSFELGELLDGENISAKFEDGILSIELPKIEPEIPMVNIVKIS